jgi:hypothetical protein
VRGFFFSPPSHDAAQGGGKGISFVIKLVASGAPITTKESIFFYVATEKKTSGYYFCMRNSGEDWRTRKQVSPKR